MTPASISVADIAARLAIDLIAVLLLDLDGNCCWNCLCMNIANAFVSVNACMEI
jgi:hypothetical protein